MKIFQLFFLVLLTSTVIAQDNKKTSFYQGTFTHGNFSSDVEFEIHSTNDSRTIKFNSLSQNAIGIPAGDIKLSDNQISFALQSDFFRYDFNCSPYGQDKMDVVLDVDGNSYQFKVYKKSKSSYTSVVTKDIRLRSNDLYLYGTIYYPENPNGKAVYLVTSSGDQDRSGSRAEAIMFAKAGFISFHIDKQGTGISDGNWRLADIPELCEDDLNALEFLHESEKMNYVDIGIQGSSQGAAKVPYLLKKRPDLAFGIVVSCPGSTLLESDLNYWKNRNSQVIGSKDIDEAADLQGAVFQYIGLTLSKSELEDKIEQNRSEEWFKNIWIPELDQVIFDKKLNYSPLPYFKDSTVPMLVIQGTEDKVIPQSSLKNIKKTLGRKRHHKTKLISLQGADHSMMLNGSSDFPYWSSKHPDYYDAILDWIPDHE